MDEKERELHAIRLDNEAVCKKNLFCFPPIELGFSARMPTHNFVHISFHLF